MADDTIITAQVATLLGVTDAAVRLVVKRGQLPATTTDHTLRASGGGTIRLFRRADVDAYAAAREAHREKLRTVPAMTPAERSRRSLARKRTAAAQAQAGAQQPTAPDTGR